MNYMNDQNRVDPNPIGGSCEARDYAQPLPKFPITAPQKPSMSSKLNKVAELFELDVLNEDEALKAFGVIIGQHTKTQKALTGTKIVDAAITSGTINDSAMTAERLGIKAT